MIFRRHKTPTAAVNVETLTPTRILGWFVPDPEAPDRPIDILIDGTCVARGVAPGGERADVIEALKVASAREFEAGIEFPPDAPQRVRVSLRTQEGDEIAAAEARVHSHVGWIDEIAGGRVSGWAFDALSPDPAQVDVLYGDRPLAEGVRADRPRLDVAAIHSGRGAAGFSAPLPEGWPEGGDPASLSGGMVRLVAADGTPIVERPVEDVVKAPPPLPQEMPDGAAPAPQPAPAQAPEISIEPHLRPGDEMPTTVLSVPSPIGMLRVCAHRGDRRVAIYLATPIRRAQAPVFAIAWDGRPAGPVSCERVASAPAGEIWRAEAALPPAQEGGESRLTVEMDGVPMLSRRFEIERRALGKVEALRRDLLTGWAVDLDRPGVPAEVELRIDGVPFGRGLAKGERDDVGRLHPPHRQAGFAFFLDPNRLPRGRHRIEVVVPGAEGPLPSKVTSVEGRLSPPVLDRLPEDRPVSIVVPVYNAPVETRECVESLLRHTDLAPGRCELILLDDKSPDEAVAPLLRGFEDHPAIRVVLQPENVGYTGNINRGIEMAGDHDVVLLNSDTRVGPGWLRRLRTAAARRPSIGTVTAVSDNAGAFSVPRMNEANQVPAWTDEEGWARLTMQRSRLLHPSVPTGSGFCLFVKRALLDEIGLFDAETFPRGYGEENEFCMRAAHEGWEHVVADDAMIFHERSASFKAAKDTLIAHASQKVPELYPEYRFVVRRDFLTGMGMQMVRHAAKELATAPAARPRPRIAFVIGVDSGGTPQTNMDLMSSIHEEYEPWLLLTDGDWIVVFRIEGAKRVEVERHRISPAIEPVFHDSPAYRGIIADILQRLAIELVHVRHVARHGLSLFEAAERLGIPVVFSLHDFYTVCPNVKLLDAEGRFCGGVCTQGEGDCRVELWRPEQVPPLRGEWVRSWQSRMEDVLRGCDHLVTTSPFARDLVRARYDLSDVPFSVIEHGRDFDEMQSVARAPEPGEPLRVFVPGNLSVPKGLDVIEGIKALDAEGRIEFHFAGVQQRDVSGLGVVHGPYKRDELPALIEGIAPHLGAVLSIWPETYSHTITELWSAGVPVVTSEFGALGERVARHGGGWSLPDLSPEAVLAELTRIAEAPQEIERRIREVAAWQEGYGSSYSIPVMADRYKRIYAGLLERGPAPAAAVALPVGGAPGIVPDIGHLRAPLEREIGRHRLTRLPEGAAPVLDQVGPLAALVVQYSGEPEAGAAHAGLIARVLPQVPLVLDVQPDCDPSLAARGAPCLDALMARAARVIAPPSLLGAIEARAPGRTAGADHGPPAASREAEHALGLVDWHRLEARPLAGFGATAVLVPAPGEPALSALNPEKIETLVVRGATDPLEADIRIAPDLGPAAAFALGAGAARGEILLFGDGETLSSEHGALIGALRNSASAAIAASGEDEPPGAFAIRMTDWAKLRGLDPALPRGSLFADLCARAEAILGRGAVRVPARDPSAVREGTRAPA